jgi:hypothetical protein
MDYEEENNGDEPDFKGAASDDLLEPEDLDFGLDEEDPDSDH